MSEPFPGERPEHHMRKTRVATPRVTCGSCRQFDGSTWCRHWNFHTSADSPPCSFYRAVPPERPPRDPKAQPDR